MDLEKLSGVKAHTLRVWEKRYGIIHPKRTGRNIRYYLDEDLKHILNIAFLNKKGMKISHIAKMDELEIEKKVAEISEIDEEFENYLDSLTLSLLEMNEYKFEKILEANFKQRGFKEAMLEVVYPLLNKLSMMWITGSINAAQENFVTNIIRQKIIAAIDNIPTKKDNGLPFFLIYLPEKEYHELSLLFMHYLLKESGFRVINLGLDVTLYDLMDAYKLTKPDFIYSIINEGYNDKPIQDYIDGLLKQLKKSKIILSGFQTAKQKIRSHPRVEILSSFPEIIQFLNQIKQNWN